MCATRRNKAGFGRSLPDRPSILIWLACVLAGAVVGLAAPPNGAQPVGTTPCAEEQSETEDPGLLWWLSRRPWWRAPPGRLGPPVIVEPTEDSLTATWAPPDDGPFPATGYDVQYRAAADADYVAWPHDGDSPRTMIVGLAEVTTYEIRIRAENEFGTGDWSLPGTGTTLLARPRFAEGESATREVPENTLAGLPVGAPVKATAGRRALTYALGGPDAGAFLIDASTGQVSTRDGVAYDHEVRPRYELTVAATAGDYVASIALTVLVTDVDEPPEAPPPPKVESVTPTSLTIAWEEPGNTGPRIDDYDVEYRAREDDFQDAGHDGRATTARLTGLESHTRYQFRVRATNAEGTGPWSESGVGTTTRTPPPNRAPEVLSDQLPGTTTLTAGGAAERFDVYGSFRDPDGDFYWLEAQSRNTSVATVAVEGHVVVRPIAAGQATIAVTAHDPMGQTATATFTVVVEAPVRSDPTASFDATGDNLTVVFTDTFVLDERRAYAGRVRQTAPVGAWGRFCFTAHNTTGVSADLSVSVDVPIESFVEPGVTYEVVYRYLGPSCADSVSAGWSRPAVATSPGSRRFDIDAVIVGTPSASLRSAVESAVDTWESIVTTSLPDVDFSTEPIPADTCVAGQPEVSDVVDDLRIFVRLDSIDGVGGTLANAGPCYRRLASGLPVVANITIDTDDLDGASSTLMRQLIVHEVGHALGFGVRWHAFSLLRNASLDRFGQEIRPPPDTHFVGPLAVAAFDVAGGTGYASGKVPVANVGGAGRADGHWRESVLGHELMTPILTVGQAQPLSAITIQSLADLGYGVDVSRAESYTLPRPATSFALRAQAAAATVPGRCIVTAGTRLVDGQPRIAPVATDAVSVTVPGR